MGLLSISLLELRVSLSFTPSLRHLFVCLRCCVRVRLSCTLIPRRYQQLLTRRLISAARVHTLNSRQSALGNIDRSHKIQLVANNGSKLYHSLHPLCGTFILPIHKGYGCFNGTAELSKQELKVFEMADASSGGKLFLFTFSKYTAAMMLCI